MNEDADSSSDHGSPGNGSVPRLTIGQRVLASLPNLQRPPATPKPAPERPAPKRAGADAGSNGSSQKDDAVITPDDVLEPGTEAAAAGGRLRDAFMKPPEPRRPRGAPSGMTKDELTHIIKRIDDRERTLAIFSAALGVGVGIALTAVALHQNPPPHVKNHVSTGLIDFEGGARVVLAGIVVLAAWKRRRSFVAFALLFLGTSMGGLFALPFWALGIWLIFRVLKWQKELATMTGGQARARATASSRPAAGGRGAGARGGGARTAGVEARRAARTERMNARAAGRKRPKKQPEQAGPPKSKRYTPPQTERPKPPVPRPPLS